MTEKHLVPAGGVAVMRTTGVALPLPVMARTISSTGGGVETAKRAGVAALAVGGFGLLHLAGKRMEQ